MSIIRSIIRNKDLEPYFLDFYEYVYITEGMSEEEELPIEYFESLNILQEKLLKLYNIQGDGDYIGGIITEALNYYLTKYSIEEILEKNNNRRLQGHKNPKSLLEKALDEQANFCLKCRSPRKVLDFESLPADVKTGFESKKDKADYFLYCQKCENYSMMYKPGVF